MFINDFECQLFVYRSIAETRYIYYYLLHKIQFCFYSLQPENLHMNKKNTPCQTKIELKIKFLCAIFMVSRFNWSHFFHSISLLKSSNQHYFRKINPFYCFNCQKCSHSQNLWCFSIVFTTKFSPYSLYRPSIMAKNNLSHVNRTHYDTLFMFVVGLHQTCFNICVNEKDFDYCSHCSRLYRIKLLNLIKV